MSTYLLTLSFLFNLLQDSTPHDTLFRLPLDHQTPYHLRFYSEYFLSPHHLLKFDRNGSSAHALDFRYLQLRT